MAEQIKTIHQLDEWLGISGDRITIGIYESDGYGTYDARIDADTADALASRLFALANELRSKEDAK